MAAWVGEVSIFSAIKELEILKFCDILCLMHEIFRIDPEIRPHFEKRLVECESFEGFLSLYNEFRNKIGLSDFNGFEGFSFTVPNLCIDQLLFKNIIIGNAFPGSKEKFLPQLIEKLFTERQKAEIKSDINILITPKYVDYLKGKNGNIITIMEVPFEVNIF
jgi:hypothetical protein